MNFFKFFAAILAVATISSGSGYSQSGNFRTRAVVEVTDEPRKQNEISRPEDVRRWILLPAFAKKRYVELLAQQDDLMKASLESKYNFYRKGSKPEQGVRRPTLALRRCLFLTPLAYYRRYIAMPSGHISEEVLVWASTTRWRLRHSVCRLHLARTTTSSRRLVIWWLSGLRQKWRTLPT